MARRLFTVVAAATLTLSFVIPAAGARAPEIDAALARLTETGPRGMGELFKVVALTDPKLGALPGFG